MFTAVLTEQEKDALSDTGAWLAAQLGLTSFDPEVATLEVYGSPERYLASIVWAAQAKMIRREREARRLLWGDV